jgi:hypothetical protein
VDNEQSCCGQNLRHHGKNRKYNSGSSRPRVSTNYFKNKMLKEKSDNSYWLFKKHEETIDHLTSGNPILEKN